jgi:hypothetical protein
LKFNKIFLIGEKGEKGEKWEEHGSFKKGHSTKGKHEIHKLDEGKKHKKFFEKEGDEAYDEKHGQFHEEHGHKKGGHKKGGHKKSDHHHEKHGKKGGKEHKKKWGHKKGKGHH